MLPFPGSDKPPLRERPPVDTHPRIESVTPAVGHLDGGASVTIRGQNFRNEADGTPPAVSFGGVAGESVVVVDSTTITVTVPVYPRAEIVNLEVTCGTQTAVLPGGFTFYEGVITKVTPEFGPLSGGTSVLITGYNFVSGSTVHFGSSAATSVTFIDAEHIRAVTPNHAIGHVDVVITEPGGAQAVKRGGFQYTLLVRGEDIRRKPGIMINDILNNAPNTCTFYVDGASNTPRVGEKIEILDSQDNDRRLFAGTVLTVDQMYEGQTDQLVWAVGCVDFTWLANRRRPFGVYANMSVTDVVKDLIAKFAPGFTTNHVQTKLAKVSVSLDGTKDLITVLTELSAAIGGGHWYFDYDQDLHFFHIVPANLVPPPTFASAIPTDHMTVAEGDAIPAVFSYDAGYYFFRHTFVYDDGTETSFQAISNVLEATGKNILSFTDVPIGPNIGSLTCVARRIYVNKLVGNPPGGDPIESIERFVQLDDNVTTDFTTWFGTTGANSTAVVAIPEDTSFPSLSFTSHPPAPETAPVASASLITADGLGMTFAELVAALQESHTDGTLVEEWGGRIGIGDAAALQAMAAVPTTYNELGNVIGFSDIDYLTRPITNFFNGSWVQFKVAYLYRNGSVSFPSPASNSTGLKNLIMGTGLKGFNLESIPVGSDVNGFDVVARFVYMCAGNSENPNYQHKGTLSLGDEWPIPFAEPTWARSDADNGLMVLPNNTDTELLEFTRMSYGTSALGHRGLLVGTGNYPYGDAAAEALSSDPIPIWPNPDGPSLEDDDPPDDITDDNEDLLHGDTGSQPFVMSVDLSQVRNRILVFGAASIAAQNADKNETQIRVTDISCFSPNGGTVRITDPATGKFQTVPYTGVDGVPGNAFIVLGQSLKSDVVQGSLVQNFFQADNIESQRFLAEVELDANGNKTDGVHEFVITDGSFKAMFQLYMRAYAELELFAWPIITIKYATRDPKSKSGQTVHVDMSNPPCEGDFLIQQVLIDQVHDESDQLSPRYTVTASSVKYGLNDLLLAILGTQTGSVTSTSGLIPTAVGLVEIPDSLDITDFLLMKKRHMRIHVFSGTSTETIGTSFTVFGANNVTNSTVDAESRFMRLGTSGSAGSSAGFETATEVAQLNHAPYYETLVKTMGGAQTGYRVWAGLQASGTPVNSDNLGEEGIMFRYRKANGSSVDSGSWFFVVHDGASQVVDEAVLEVMPDKAYRLSIAVDPVTDTITWRAENVTDGVVKTGQTAIPAAFNKQTDTLVGTINLVEIQAGVKNFLVSHMFIALD